MQKARKKKLFNLIWKNTVQYQFNDLENSQNNREEYVNLASLVNVNKDTEIQRI